MLNPIFKVVSSFNADLFNIIDGSIFAFDFKEETYWISDMINRNEKQIPISVSKDSYVNYKVSLCPTLPLLAHISKSQTSVEIIDTQTSTTLNTISNNDSKIECIAISHDGSTILIGGKNGVLTKYSVYDSKLLGVPSRHKDSILFALESPDSRYIVSVGYDKNIMLFADGKDKIGTLIAIAPSVIKCGIFIKDSTLLVLGDAFGFIYVIETASKQVIRKIQASFTQIIAVQFFRDSLICCLNDNGVICMIDFNKSLKVVENFVPNPKAKYKNFYIKNNQVTLSSADKIIVSYNLDDFAKHLNELVKSDIAEAYRFVEENKFLENELSFLRLNAKFDADLLECIALACSNNREPAMEILREYATIPLKSSLIQNIINDIGKINEFGKLMRENMEYRAIPMAQKYAILRKMKQYSDFEERFSKLIIIVKELIKKKKINEANLIIAPFKKFPSQYRIIQEVIKNPNKVDEALEALNSRDYALFAKIKREYHFVGSLQATKDFENSLPNYYFNLLNAFYSLDISSCRKYISILKNFKQYNADIEVIESNLEKIENLISNI